MWANPTPYTLIPTADSESFRQMPLMHTGLPIGEHPGAFGVRRKFHTHEGVDLYVPMCTPITAVEAGEVVAVLPFTGPSAGSPWWLDTKAVFVEGESGVVVYGEITPHIQLGSAVNPGTIIGVVSTVLRHDKGRPRNMLHIELHSHGSRQSVDWTDFDHPPEVLKDPTPLLLACVPVETFYSE